MPYAKAKDGTMLYYKDWGRGDPVVLLHGWPLTGDTFDDLAIKLVENGKRCIIPDRRGFGRSEQPWDGYNVVVHEMAHKLDMLDGPPDGVPPLREIPRRRWIGEFQRAYDRLVAAGPGHSPIDHYATESAGEYFAVVSELHFSDPHLLAQVEPAVAAQLHAFYGPSPAP